jgi:ParB/RepB/Spo0J family partition protein
MRQTHYDTIDPRKIVILRETRQRQENLADREDLKQSIQRIGIINPLVVRHQEDKIILVAGERRLTSALDLALPLVPVRFFEDLSEEESEIVELEENLKRKELSWKDQVRAIGRIHLLHKKNQQGWTIEKTAETISLHHTYLRKILHVFDALDSGRVNNAESIEQAYNTLHRFSERKAESIVGDIIAKGAAIFGQAATATTNAIASTTNTILDQILSQETITSTSAVKVFTEDQPKEEIKTPPTPIIPPSVTSLPSDPIICANFIEWAKTYSGPKFTLIHCDFPYGNYRGDDSQGALSGLETEEFYDNTESVYWTLLDALTENLPNIMSYSAHLVFWFNMNFYTETVSRLRKAGLMVHDHPLIWSKAEGGSGGRGVVPGNAVMYPRRMYDTALLAVRGNRPLAKPGDNRYHAPTVGNKIHPSQKPEPMLRHFLSMVVDETTTVLDPTCGSAAALRAAEDLGAKAILGIEMDPNYAASALTRTLQARVLRQAGTLRRD